MGTFHSPSFHGLPQADRIILKYKQKDLLKRSFFYTELLISPEQLTFIGTYAQIAPSGSLNPFSAALRTCAAQSLSGKQIPPSLQLVIRICCNIIPRLIPHAVP